MIPSIMLLDRRALRRRNVSAFIRLMAEKHPELRNQVTHAEFMTIAERDRVSVRVVPLSRPARLIRVGQWPCIQLDRALNREERTRYGMHELCHFWRDDPGEPCFNAEDNPLTDRQEEFADIFSWLVTCTSRPFIPGLRDEDF